MRVVLGSSSQWRRMAMLDLFGNVETDVPDIDERKSEYNFPVAEQKALTIARAKADALLSRPEYQAPAGSRSGENVYVITADQVVRCNGEIREKPIDANEARRYLHSYRAGLPAETVSAIVVSHPSSGRRTEGVHVSKVRFSSEISDADIDQLISEGQIFTCAGGFIAEHPLLQKHILELDGSMDSVKGLPFDLTRMLVEDLRRQVEHPQS